MKKLFLASLISLSFFGVYAMEEEKGAEVFPYEQLLQELDCAVMECVLKNPAPVELTCEDNDTTHNVSLSYSRESMMVCTEIESRHKRGNGWASSKSSIKWHPDLTPERLLHNTVHHMTTIKAVTALLFAELQLQNPKLSQYFLLRQLQEVSKEKKPLFIGQSDRETLKGMLKLKELLRVERSLSKTKNPIWRLQLKSACKESEQGDGWLSNCAVM